MKYNDIMNKYKNRIKKIILIASFLILVMIKDDTYAKDIYLPESVELVDIVYCGDEGYWSNGEFFEKERMIIPIENKYTERLELFSTIITERVKGEKLTYIESEAVMLDLEKGKTYEIVCRFLNPTEKTMKLAIKCDDQLMAGKIEIDSGDTKAYKFTYTAINDTTIFQPYLADKEGSVYIESIQCEEKKYNRKKAVVILGDSTARYYTKESQRGSFGTTFMKYLKKGEFATEKIKIGGKDLAYKTTGLKRYDIINVGKSGESAKSYIKSGIFNRVLSEMQKGDIVFVNFGHNDLTSTSPLYNTDIRTYTEYMTNIVECIKIKGATPVLVSPIPMSTLGDIKNVKKEKVAAIMKKIAKKSRIEYIPMYENSRKFVSRNPKKVKKMYVDSTHTNKRGGEEYGKIFAKLIKKDKKLKKIK